MDTTTSSLAQTSENRAELPLSSMQEGMLFHSLRAPKSGVEIEQILIRLRESLEPATFVRSFEYVVAARDALRVRFDWRGRERPVQFVSRETRVPGETLDWSSFAKEAREERLRELLRRDRATDFDLEHDPLLRLAIVDVGDEGTIVLWTFHHAILDGRSFPLVLTEAFDVYESLLAGATPRLGARMSFGDFLRHDRQHPPSEAAEAYFRRLLAGFDSPTRLDVGFVARLPAGATERSVALRLGERETEAVIDAARRHGVTPNTLFQSAWALVLGCYARSSDVVFGATRACRTDGPEGVREVAGLLINTLPMRVRTDRDTTVAELFRSVRSQQVALRPHERTSLAFATALSDVPRGAALFDTITVFDDATLDHAMKRTSSRFRGCQFDYFGQTNFALTLAGYLDPEMLLRLEFDPARFDRDTASRMLSHVALLLRRFVEASAETKVRALSLLSTEERHRILEEWNDTDGPFPSHERLYDAFEANASRDPGALAIVCGGHTLSYGEVDRRANRLAHHLVGRGVAPGDRVGICLPRSADLVVALLAVEKAGAAYVPLDPEHPAERVAFMLTDTGTKVVVTVDPLRGRLPATGVTIVSLDGERPEIAIRSSARMPSTASPDDVAYVIFTSGSTGVPKGVVVRHGAAVNLIDWVNHTFDVGPDDRLLFVTSPCFDLSVYDVFGILAAGGSIHIATSEELREPRALVSLLRTGEITFWDSAPATLAQLVPFLPDDDRASALRLVFLSGDFIPVPLPDQVRRGFPGAEVVSLGGATEATIWSNYYRIGDVDPRWPTIPYGRPIRNARYYVLDDRLEPVPIGVPGELYIGGGCLADGYHERPALNAEKFLPNPHRPGTRLYRTGDLARFMPCGNLEFLGRVDLQVKVRGFRIELGEIESVLNRLPAVTTSLVDAPRLTGHERTLVAYLVGDETQIALDAVRAHCRLSLPDYMVPSHFVVIDGLPTTSNGKVDRRALPAPLATTSRAYEPPVDALEEEIAELFATCLAAPRVGRHDAFFELGGHSLLAVRIIGEISSRRGVDVSLAAFLAEPTVARLAELVRTSDTAASPTRLEAHPAAPAILSFAQRRFVLLQRLDPRDASYNVPFVFRIDGRLDVACLRHALDALLERHEALRTSFTSSGLEERATIHDRVTLPWLEIDLESSSPVDRGEQLSRALHRRASTPFRLEEAPLLRATLVHLSPHEHVLGLVAHHAVVDGTSIGVLQDELVALYDAFHDGRPNPLRGLTVRANDYAIHQLEAAESGAWDEAVAYFRRELVAPLPILALPTDRPRPVRFATSGASVPITLSRETVDALESVAKAHDTTLFTVLFASYLVLLHRHSGQDDLIVGTPVSGRDLPESFALVGAMIDTIAIRASITGDLPFSDLVERVKSKLLGALEHRGVPFERLVEELRPPRDPATTPIFQTLFSYEETGGRTRRGESFELSPYRMDSGSARTDLSVFLTRSPEDGLAGYFEYATALFDAPTMRAMVDGFAAVLAHAASSPELPVGALRVTSDADRARELVRASDPFESFDFDATVVHRFEAEAARHPERVAVVHAGRTRTYGELRDDVHALEASLRALGATPDRAVAVFLERGPRLVTAMLAAIRLGAYYVPLDPSHPADRNARILRLARPAVIVTERGATDRLPLCEDVVLLDLDASPPRASSSVTDVEATAGRLAYVIFTSGSTGDPKGVEITHGNLTNFLCSVAIRPGMTANDHLVSVTTPSFDIAGLELFLPLVTGASVEIVDRRTAGDPQVLSERLLAGPATMFQATPSTYRMLLDAGVPGLDGVKCLCGGEPLPRDLLDALLPRVGSLFNMYGPTETTIWSSFDEMKANESVISIGRPIHNTRMYVLDERLEPVPRGVTGMLYIGGAGVARGYHGSEELTRGAFLADPFTGDPRDRIYRTGDLARRLPDGRLECLGRSDFQVKIRGYRIELGEIEAALATHPKVRQAVVEVDRESAEPRLVAFAVPDGTPTREELLEHLRARVPTYMVPASVVLVADLPLTSNGKIDRKALRGPSIEARAKGERTRPRDDVEVRVASIFEELLSIRHPCIHASFFELGGHSLLALRLVRELNAAFGVELPIGPVFAMPTVAAIARTIREGGGAAQATVIPLHRGHQHPPVYFVCGIHVYQTLASSLGEEQPSYGIFLPAEQDFFKEGARATSVIDLASLYVAAMRAHDPKGPYVLAGVSFGGLLAFEMARQLRASGADVPLLVLIDAVLPRAIRINPRKWLAFQLAKLRERGADLLSPRPASDGPLAPNFDAELDRMRRAVYGRAAREYDQGKRRFDGRTVLIRASESGFVGRDLDEDLGWGERLDGEFRVFESIGDHLGVLREPLTAEIIRKELARLRPRAASEPAERAASELVSVDLAPP